MELATGVPAYVVALVVLLGIVGAAVYGLRKLREGLVANAMRRMERSQHRAFVLRLRDLVFQDPYRFVGMLTSPGREEFAHKLWREMGWSAGRAAHAAALPAEGLRVHPALMLDDGRAAVVVSLPVPELRGEAHVVGVVLPRDESLKTDLRRAREVARFFLLECGSTDSARDTELCEWTVGGKYLTFNMSAPTDPRGFAGAVQAKLHELGR